MPAGCRDGEAFDLPICMAFQPILSRTKFTVFAYETPVRGEQGEVGGDILACVDDTKRYEFDKPCRVKAIELSAARPSGWTFTTAFCFRPCETLPSIGGW